ncbi:MAG: acylneuraminate cytidylyltransferase family protein [Phycisphaera sp.]|nr:acylneuraminate cytidylyltransferase family protein [Phycisphaera sp.]
MKHATAIIPARGGSKGIPRKNLWRLNGKPLVCWAIEAAQAAERVGSVVVSTDDAEIAEISRAAGAKVVMRPAAISTDTASSEAALIHALENLDETPDLTVFLQCTTPLTQGGDIDACIGRLIDTQADSAFTASESHRFLWKRQDDAVGVNHDGAERRRRQDLETEFSENGAVYVMRTPGFLSFRHRFFGRTVISEMPASRSWEIDSLEDIRIVQALAALPASTLPECRGERG